MVDHYVGINPDNRPFFMNYISYKPNTDIYEESQQLALCESLLQQGYQVIVNPCDKMPVDLRDSLQQKYGDRISFQSRPQDIPVVEIMS
jgi:UDP-glucose 6-dehydrogenase